MKRDYHPLVVFFFYAGLLSEKQLIQIPKSTLKDWKAKDHTQLFGYEWVKSFFDQYEQFMKQEKRKIEFRNIRLSVRMLDYFHTLLSDLNGVHKAVNNHAPLLVGAVERTITAGIHMDRACKAFGISIWKYYRLKNKVFCSASKLNLCYKTHPNQLTLAECHVIQQALEEPANLRKKRATLWGGLLRADKLFCSRSTFYKYANLVVLQHIREKKKKIRSVLQSRYPYEYIHIDTTLIPTLHEGTLRAVAVKDHFSKFILYMGIVPSGASVWVAQILDQLEKLHGWRQNLKKTTFVSDGGSENKGAVIQWLEDLQAKHIKKVTAKSLEFEYSNNEVESVFHLLKNEFLGNRAISSSLELGLILNEFRMYNNNERFPIALYGLTPQEVLDGAIIDKHRFTQQIKEAKRNRHLINKKMEYCEACKCSTQPKEDITAA